MAKAHTAHDDYVEVELERGTARIQAALQGLEAARQKRILQAIEVCLKEAVDQTLEWAAQNVEESDALVAETAERVLVAAAGSDEPAIVGRVYGTLRLLGLEPNVAAAVKACRAARGSRAAAALAEHLASVQAVLSDDATRRPARRRGAAKTVRR